MRKKGDTVTRDELQFCRRAMLEMIENPAITQPNINQVSALIISLDAMRKYKETERNIAVLQYHVSNPGALMCRDRYTLTALRAGLRAVGKYIHEVEADAQR